MKRHYLILIYILLPLLLSYGQTGTFNFDKKTTINGTSDVTQKVASIVLTVTANNDLVLNDISPIGGTSGNSVYVNSPAQNMTLSFSKAAKITTLIAFENYGASAAWTFTSNTGASVTQFVNGTNGNIVTLNFVNITSITITSSTNLYFGIDDVKMRASLPVELTSFTAITLKNGVMLNWQTATEVNNYGFEIERASSSTMPVRTNWETISFIEGHGNSNSPKDYSFYDKSPSKGNAIYRLKQIDTDGGFEYSEEVEISFLQSDKTELYQNHPNPFNPSTVIRFSIPELSQVNITVYNAIGQKVMELVNDQLDAGYHNVNFNGANLSTGFYFYRLETSNYLKTMKMILLR